MFVAIIYCYMCTEVHKAFYRCYRRFQARWEANRRLQQMQVSFGNCSLVALGLPVSAFRNTNSRRISRMSSVSSNPFESSFVTQTSRATSTGVFPSRHVYHCARFPLRKESNSNEEYARDSICVKGQDTSALKDITVTIKSTGTLGDVKNICTYYKVTEV